MKKTIILPILMMLCISCSYITSDSRSEKNKIKPLTEERFQQLFQSIPDGIKVNNPEENLSNDYYSTWQEAWLLPDGGLGEIGFNEFLCYFICGNDPCESHTASCDLNKVKYLEDTAYVDFEIQHRRKADMHSFKLVNENDNWIIADYDNTLAHMKQYIHKQRDYLRSSDYNNSADMILNDPYASDEWKKAVRKEIEEVDAYFEKRP